MTDIRKQLLSFAIDDTTEAREGKHNQITIADTQFAGRPIELRYIPNENQYEIWVKEVNFGPYSFYCKGTLAFTLDYLIDKVYQVEGE